MCSIAARRKILRSMVGNFRKVSGGPAFFSGYYRASHGCGAGSRWWPYPPHGSSSRWTRRAPSCGEESQRRRDCKLSGTRSYFGQQDSGHAPFWFGTIRPGRGYSMMRIINICLYICVVSFVELYTNTYIFCDWGVVGALVPSPCTSIVYTQTHTRRGKLSKNRHMYENCIIFCFVLRFVV